MSLSVSPAAISRKLLAPAVRIAATTSAKSLARAAARSAWRARPAAIAFRLILAPRKPPNATPRAFAAARACLGALHRPAPFEKSPTAEITDLANFDAAIEKARYLFGPEIHIYLKQVRGKLVEIHVIGRALAELPTGEARSRAEDKVSEALGEMHQFYERLAEMITPYLRITTDSPQRSIMRIRSPIGPGSRQ